MTTINSRNKTELSNVRVYDINNKVILRNPHKTKKINGPVLRKQNHIFPISIFPKMSKDHSKRIR